MRNPTYLETAEGAWQWTLGQLRWDADGPWIPGAVVDGVEPEVSWDRDSMHSGVAGLLHTLAEIRLARAWTPAEAELADAVAERLIAVIPATTDVSYFDGLVSTIGALVAAQRPDGVRAAVDRLLELAEDDGWPQTQMLPPKFLPGARIHDMTLGTAGVLLGGTWAARHGVESGVELANRAADILLTESAANDDLGWPFVPQRFRTESGAVMPNLSHGLAGVSAALAAGGIALDRPELVGAATRTAEQLISLGRTDGRGFVVQRYIPTEINDEDEVTYTWCHGASGTSLAFAALDAAGVPSIAGTPPAEWRARCLYSVRTSGLPERLHPGFWDNDGRCCGTAGVGDILLDAWHRTRADDDLAFARRLADTLVAHAIHTDGTYWRFTEHRNEDPLLPPSVGWMQGAAGIAAFLFHTARVVEHGPAAQPQARMDTWWAG
ncbi:lanthionine synthetase LanC family protein [Kribbella sp. NPDC051770]|uniref:lanthionine synthetase LanC family protein n=1 Tax=Kribbella sp. NPDC051770 TaxID=3155413 RepID=UPI003418468B